MKKNRHTNTHTHTHTHREDSWLRLCQTETGASVLKAVSNWDWSLSDKGCVKLRLEPQWQNTFLQQIIVTFVIKTADLTVNTIKSDIILKNTTHKKWLKYAPLLSSLSLFSVSSLFLDKTILTNLYKHRYILIHL